MKKIFLCITLCLFCICAHADFFLIENIPVSAEAETTAQAKDKAILDAQTTAFQQLLLTVLLKEDYEKMPTLSAEEIADLVKDISIQNERTTSTKYAASISVRFDNDALKTLFARHSVPYLTQKKIRFVVVPVFETPAQTLIFDENSPLFKALLNSSTSNNLYTLIVPGGDLQDIKTATPEIIRNNRLSALEPLKARYNADEILILKVQQETPIYNITTKTYPTDESLGADLDFAVSSRSTDLLDVNTKIVQKIMDKIKQNWRKTQTAATNGKNTMTVIVPIRSLPEWTMMRTQIEKLPFLDKVALQSLRKDKATIEISSAQSQAALIQSFKNNGFTLQQDATRDWILTRSIPSSFQQAEDFSAPSDTPVNLIGQSLQEHK